jgi:hypothetical protein
MREENQRECLERQYLLFRQPLVCYLTSALFLGSALCSVVKSDYSAFPYLQIQHNIFDCNYCNNATLLLRGTCGRHGLFWLVLRAPGATTTPPNMRHIGQIGVRICANGPRGVGLSLGSDSYVWLGPVL